MNIKKYITIGMACLGIWCGYGYSTETSEPTSEALQERIIGSTWELKKFFFLQERSFRITLQNDGIILWNGDALPFTWHVASPFHIHILEDGTVKWHIHLHNDNECVIVDPVYKEVVFRGTQIDT